MRLRRNFVQNVSASLGPTFMPMTWRWPSLLTATATLTATITMEPASRALTWGQLSTGTASRPRSDG